MKSNLYVVRASHIQPFFQTLRKFDTPIEPLLANVGLNLAMFEHDENLIPEAPLWEFIDLAATHLSMPHFGFAVTENVCIDQYGVFGEHLCCAENLHVALERFIESLNTHVNFPNYWLEQEGDYIWLCRKGTPGIEKGKWPVEQHVISFFIELVRVYAGKNWQPQKVKFHSDDLGGIEYAKSLQKSEISKGQPYGAIAIEVHVLAEPSLLLDKAEKSKEALLTSIPTDLTVILQELFQQGLLHQGYFGKELDMNNIAKKMGINLRMLQRRLEKHNTTLKSLVEHARYQSAQTLLKNEMSTTNIAEHLGYSDVSNFMRSFKRWSGLTPKQYKNELGI